MPECQKWRPSLGQRWKSLVVGVLISAHLGIVNDAAARRPVIGERLSPPVTKLGGCF
jgi:hypothetical protein